MSIAWATIALIVLLLPGVLFSVGVFLPGNVAREAVPRSTLGEIASSLLVSFAIHGVLFSFISPAVDTEALLAILQVDGDGKLRIGEMAAVIDRSRVTILVYVLGTSTVGLLSGILLGRLIAYGSFRWLVQHGWVLSLYEQRGKGHVLAHVMTHVREGNRVLMYRGYLEQFGLQKDGSFAYLTLSDPSRYYMYLEEQQPVTSRAESWRQIGTARTATLMGRRGTRMRTILVVEGEDIQNVVFEWFEYADLGRIGSIEVLFDDSELAKVFGVTPDRIVFRRTSEEKRAERKQPAASAQPQTPPERPGKPRRRKRR
ncbi:MAG: hypothetical protein ACT443_09735 [Gemmatimonadota bacterium]